MNRQNVLLTAGALMFSSGFAAAFECPPCCSSSAGGEICALAGTICEGQTSFSTAGSTTDGPPHEQCNFFGNDQISQDIWYNYTSTCKGELSISLCGSEFDSKAAIYKGHGCLGALIDCDDDYCGVQPKLLTYRECGQYPDDNISDDTYWNTDGEAFKIRVGGFGGSEGAGTINIACTEYENPFPAPKANDRTFVATEEGLPSEPAYSPGLDTPCVDSDHGPLIIRIPVTRYLGPVYPDGRLQNVSEMIDRGFLSKYAILTIPALDVDYDDDGPCYPSEEDRVFFVESNELIPVDQYHADNSAHLQGPKDLPWATLDRCTINTFRIPIGSLRFPAARGVGGNPPEPAINEIRIEIDAADSGHRWCTALDWASLSIQCMSPIILIHGNGSNGGFFARQQFTQYLDTEFARFYDNSINLAAAADPPGRASIEDNSEELADFIPSIVKSFGADSVHLVAHSKGGLDTRHYLAQHYSEEHEQLKVLSLTTLSTPHDGSAGADRLDQEKNWGDKNVTIGTGNLPWFADLLAFIVGTDAGVPDLTTYKAIEWNRLNKPLLPRDVDYRAVIADADRDSDGLLWLPLEVSGMAHENAALALLPIAQRQLVCTELYQFLRLFSSVTVLEDDFHHMQFVGITNTCPCPNDTLVNLRSGSGLVNKFSTFVKQVHTLQAPDGRNHANVGNSAYIVLPWLRETERKRGDLKW